MLATGLLLISMSVGTAAVMPFAGGLVDRFGGGIVSVAGGVATVATTLPFAILDTGADGILVPVLLVLRGMALALAVMPAATAAYKATSPASSCPTPPPKSTSSSASAAPSADPSSPSCSPRASHRMSKTRSTPPSVADRRLDARPRHRGWLAATERRTGDRHGSLRV